LCTVAIPAIFLTFIQLYIKKKYLIQPNTQKLNNQATILSEKQ
jgi:hypothetical protein